MKRCPDMCINYWLKQDLPDGLLCPGCIEWVDKDGKKWRQINLPQIQAEQEEEGER